MADVLVPEGTDWNVFRLWLFITTACSCTSSVVAPTSVLLLCVFSFLGVTLTTTRLIFQTSSCPYCKGVVRRTPLYGSGVRIGFLRPTPSSSASCSIRHGFRQQSFFLRLYNYRFCPFLVFPKTNSIVFIDKIGTNPPLRKKKKRRKKENSW